jgi:hypothetical protein
MLLVVKFAAVVGLVASSANWLGANHDVISGNGVRTHSQSQQASHNTSQMPFNICQNNCNFLSLVSLAH